MQIELSEEGIQNLATLAIWCKNKMGICLTKPEHIIEIAMEVIANHVCQGRENKRVQNIADAEMVLMRIRIEGEISAKK